MCSSWLLREGQTELAEEETSLVVVLRIGDDGDVHPLGLVDLGDVDLGEDEVVANAERVIDASVERLRRHAAEVAHARQGGGDQAVEELVHFLAAQGDHRADSLSFAQLEAGDRFLGLGDDGLLSGDLSQLVDSAVEDLGVRDRFAHPHVEDDFLDLGNSHRVLDPELVLDLLSDFSLVELFESWCHWFPSGRRVRPVLGCGVLGVGCGSEASFAFAPTPYSPKPTPRFTTSPYRTSCSTARFPLPCDANRCGSVCRSWDKPPAGSRA